MSTGRSFLDFSDVWNSEAAQKTVSSVCWNAEGPFMCPKEAPLQERKDCRSSVGFQFEGCVSLTGT